MRTLDVNPLRDPISKIKTREVAICFAWYVVIKANLQRKKISF